MQGLARAETEEEMMAYIGELISIGVASPL